MQYYSDQIRPQTQVTGAQFYQCGNQKSELTAQLLRYSQAKPSLNEQSISEQTTPKGETVSD